MALEASPLTTLIEEYVGQQLCLMLGYNITNPMIDPIPKDGDLVGPDPLPDAWGHITCVRKNSQILLRDCNVDAE